MGQSKSTAKSCARPSSSMFHNNLAQMIKDSAFKKHLSSHGFIPVSNFRDLESGHSRSSGSQKDSTVYSNLISSKEDFRKNKECSFYNTYNFTDTGQGFKLSDIQESQAEYEDQEVKKNQFKANTCEIVHKSIKPNKSRKGSDEKLYSQGRQREKVSQQIDHKFLQHQENNYFQGQITQTFTHQQIQNIHKLQSDHDQSNLILFTESKNVPSCKSLQPQKVQPSFKSGKSLLTDQRGNSCLQLQSNQLSSRRFQKFSENEKKIQQSNIKKSKQLQNEHYQSHVNRQRKSKRKKVSDKVESEQRFDKTIVNQTKKPFHYADEHSITIRLDKTGKTLNHQHQKLTASKQKSSQQNLFMSCKKVFASQIISSKISIPESPTLEDPKQIWRNDVNRLINSKSFEEDLQLQKSEVESRRSLSYREKLRESISLGRVRKKLMQETMGLDDRQGAKNEASNYVQETQEIFQEKEENCVRRSQSRLSLSTRMRSQIRQKLSRSHSQKSSPNQVHSFIKQKNDKTQQKSKDSVLSARKQKKMQKKQIIQNFQCTQQNYFNENIDNKSLTPCSKQRSIHLKNNQKSLKLINNNQALRPSEYEIQISNKQGLKQSQQQFHIEINKRQPLATPKKTQTKNVKKLFVFSDQLTYRFEENSLDKTKNLAVKIPHNPKQSSNNPKQQKKIDHRFNPNQPIESKYRIESQNRCLQKTLTTDQIKTLTKIQKITPTKTQCQPQQSFSNNYLQKDFHRTHLSVQYLSKKNPQPSDKRPMNLIKFSQLQPNPFDVMTQQKLIQTTSAKNYPYNYHNDKDSNIYERKPNQRSHHKSPQIMARNIQIIEKLINSNPSNDYRSNKHKKQSGYRNQDYEVFIQQLQKLKKIKQIQQKLLQQNMEQLKKSTSSYPNKLSILDLKKDLINDQISARIQRMNKLKEINKLTNKVDPASLVKSKSSEFLREQPIEGLQNDVQNYYRKHNPKKADTLKMQQLNQNHTYQDYMIDMTKSLKTKPLKVSKKESIHLASIPESPQIKQLVTEKEKNPSITPRNNIKLKRTEEYGQTPRLYETKLTSVVNKPEKLSSSQHDKRFHEGKLTASSSQKTITKKTLFVF